MDAEARWNYLNELDEELLLGGVMLSERTSVVVRHADLAYVAGASLAVLALAQAAMESHLALEYGEGPSPATKGFYDLVERSPLDPDLRAELHALRRLRNGWLHAEGPQDEEDLLARPVATEVELDAAARGAVRLLRRVLYLEQWV